MNLTMKSENGVLTVYLEGMPDSESADSAKKEIEKAASNAQKIILDLKKLSFLSSAVLRLILKLNKKMRKKGGVTITNANESMLEVLSLTGFTDIVLID